MSQSRRALNNNEKFVQLNGLLFMGGYGGRIAVTTYVQAGRAARPCSR
jgi:hypothetical protein